MYRLVVTALSLAFAGSKAEQAQCIVTGPSGTKLKRTFGVSLQTCKTDCKASSYDEKRAENEMAFQKSFTPVKQGSEGLCACAQGPNLKRKLVLKVRPGTCRADNDGVKEDCWMVYKLFLKLHDNVNIWSPNVECELCSEGTCPDVVEMPRNIDAAEIAHLKQQAEEGDPEAINMLEQIERGRFKGMVITTLYEWRVGGQAHEIPDSNGGSFEALSEASDDKGWTRCDKPCADEMGPGQMYRSVECYADGGPADDEDCLSFFGYQPARSKECNALLCERSWKCMGPNNEEFPAEDCGDLPETNGGLDNIIV